MVLELVRIEMATTQTVKHFARRWLARETGIELAKTVETMEIATSSIRDLVCHSNYAGMHMKILSTNVLVTRMGEDITMEPIHTMVTGLLLTDALRKANCSSKHTGYTE